MRSAIAFTVAALAGSAIAAPSYGRPAGGKNIVYDINVETVVKTVYVTEGFKPYHARPRPSKAPEPAYPAPAQTTTVVEAAAPAPTSSSVYVAPPAPTSEAPAPTSEVYSAAPPPTTEVYSAAPQPTSEAPAPTSEVYSAAPQPTTEPAPSSGDYMSIVDEWRAKLGLSKLEKTKKLEDNAMNVVVEGNGVMKHKLNPGTFGQVLAPGKPDGFLKVFVGGWLCELPNLPGLDGVCGKMSEGWSYEGQTGHAEILTSPQYTQIGCASFLGIWCCDLA